MRLISHMSDAPVDAYSRLVRELQAEYRCDDVEGLADRIVESEAADFHWEARVEERYLGQHLDPDLVFEGAGEELARVAVLSHLGAQWSVAICLVDGEGRAVDLLWRLSCSDRLEAELAFARAR